MDILLSMIFIDLKKEEKYVPIQIVKLLEFVSLDKLIGINLQEEEKIQNLKQENLNLNIMNINI